MSRVLLLLLVPVALWPARGADAIPGRSVFGEHRYIEYLAGDLPIVIAAPHGGRLVPEEIPDRTEGVRDADANTQELARTIAGVLHEHTGGHAHLVINLLHRRKLDANRDLAEAAQGSPLAGHAWREHHAFIEQACRAAVRKFGAAFFIDLHGHAHPIRRLELGYLHDAEDFAKTDAELNAPGFAAKGSLTFIAARSREPYVELLRGAGSLGALLERAGFPATPSPSAPLPVAPYFRGGYTVERHCQAAAKVAGLQIECNRPGVRDTAENRLAFAKALATALATYLPAQLGVPFKPAQAAGQ